MKIVGTTNKAISCIWTTIGKGIERFGNKLGLETVIYDREDFLNHRIVGTDEQTVFIFEAGTPQHAGYSMARIKQLFPNSILIALSSDAIIYKNVLQHEQLDYKYIDILMDVEDEAMNYYSNKYRIIGEKWLWTTSEWLIEAAENFISPPLPKLYDFICVAIFSGPFRRMLRDYLIHHGLSITNGGGCGHEDNDLRRLFTHYKQSRWTLGTTSHNNPQIRGMKGFRDWIGPFLGAPLIYDNYFQVMGAYGSVVPYYDYTDFSSIKSLINMSENKREELCTKQRMWARLNTIEEQLYKVCKKHGIL